MSAGAPPGRRGAPRPLAAHVLAGLADLQQGVALAALADDARFPWRRANRDATAELGEALGALDVALGRDAARKLFAREAARAALADARAAFEGMSAYRAAPPLRRPPEPPTVWSLGSARLLDYGLADDRGPAGAPLLVTPSLVNGPAILDLSRARSFLRGLAQRGLRPFLLDWGAPKGEERGFDAADYVRERAAPALRAAVERAGRPAALLGHCMGGALAAALAAIEPERTARLALVATPWDYASLGDREAALAARSAISSLIEVSGAVFGGVPPDILNTLFFFNDPLQAMRKFPRARRIAKRGAAERLFVAVEDWLNDGKLLAAPAARTLFIDWALDNTLAEGEWIARTAAGEERPVRLDQIDAPVLVAASRTDTLTPFASARAAFVASAGARLLRPSGGHIGMIVGGRAEREFWDPLAGWLAGEGS